MDFVFDAHFMGCLAFQSYTQKTDDVSGEALKSVLWLLAEAAGIVGMKGKVSRQGALDLEVVGFRVGLTTRKLRI